MIRDPSNDLSAKLALDTKSLGDLRQSAKAGKPEALKEAAQQFEALFINMMMKSMRDATPQEGMLDNQHTKTFTTMLDQQLSQNLAKRGMGLADVLVRQLSAQTTNAQALAINGGPPSQEPAALPMPRDAAAMMKTPGALPPVVLPERTASGRLQTPHVRAFQERFQAHAVAAEQVTGVPAKFMLGQAGLETGWGKRVIRNADGSSSNNLFGIKAGPGWKGKVATAVTTEYVNGRPQTRVEKFRSYDSPSEAFKDYANMLANSPRYEKVIANSADAASFARNLQRAGYATDPHYATKLTRIINNSLV